MGQARKLLLAGVGGAVLFLSGCNTLDGLVGPTLAAPAVPSSPSDQPSGQADWVEYAPDQLPSADWIAGFDSPRLTRLVDEAIAENPNLRRATAQFEGGLARARISRADLYPSLSNDNRFSRSEGGTGFFAGRSNYDVGFNASWEIDLFGRIRDRVSADLAGAQASAADLAGIRVSVAGQVANAWFDAIEADRLVSLSDNEIETRERSLRLTTRRFEAGLTGASDVRLAKSSLASSKATRDTRVQQRNATVRNLQGLMRDYPDANLELPSTLPFLPVFEGAGSPEDMVRTRPDIIAAEARIAEAGLNVDVARKAMLPGIRLTGGFGDQATSSNGIDPVTGEENNSSILSNIGDIFDLSDLAFNLASSITTPIFQGGRLDAQVDSARAQLAANLEAYAETTIAAYREVENALDAEGLLASREASLRDALEEASLAEERLERRYVEGLATILQLLDAQQRALSAEGQLINAQAERLANRVRLHVALGGGKYATPPATVLEPVEVPLIDTIGNAIGDLVSDDTAPANASAALEPSAETDTP